MRCTNCGWDNTTDNSQCIKCNTALSAAPEENAPPRNSTKKGDHFAGTLMDTDYNGHADRHENKAPTIADHGNLAGATINESEDLIICPAPGCGYPNLSNATICSVCKRPLETSPEAQGATNTGDAYYKITQMPSSMPSNSPSGYNSTIDPYRSITNDDYTCYLHVINKDDALNEKHEGIIKEYNYDNSPIELNRGNLDPENITITGKIQAELINKNGKWFIKDRSELQTTFLRVSGEAELNEGDIILMGDRKFIFSTPKN